MIFLRIIVVDIILVLIGFMIGRVSHIIGGHLNGPHHWIPGLIFVIVGLIFYRQHWGIPLFLFGAGLFVSDLKDFFDLRFWDVDDVEKKVFWRID